jgi:hypothetical protein
VPLFLQPVRRNFSESRHHAVVLADLHPIESQLVDPRFSLDAQANRFRDLILSSDIYGLSGMYRP